MTLVNGVNFQQTGNPQADLVTYANARGIDQATAKKELEAQFGAPTVQQQTSVDEDSKLVIDNSDNNNISSITSLDTLKALIKAIITELLGKYITISDKDNSDDVEDKKDTTTTTKTDDDTTTTSSKSSSSTTTTSTTKSSSSSSSSSNGVRDTWQDRLNSAYANGDKNGIKMAQKALKDLDKARAAGRPPKAKW